MKKLVLVLLAVVMVFALFAGCAKSGSPDKSGAESEKPGKSIIPEEPSTPEEPSASLPEESEFVSSGSPVVDSYTAFVNAKSAVLTKLSDALSNNPDTLWASMSLLGVAVVDMYMIPVACFGLGKAAAEMSLGVLGAKGVTYTENGNSYTITYTDDKGVTTSMTGVWDAAADSLVCTGTSDGTENFYSEYRKTSYGYVAQYYIVNDDGKASLYVITVSGEDGAFGISSEAEKPSPLTGGEAFDFPAGCAEWYAINGSTVTGKTSDGKTVNFEYVPTES